MRCASDKRKLNQVQKHKTINHQYYCWVVLAVSSIPRTINN